MSDDLVELIYEAAFDASRWQDVVQSLATETQSIGGQLLLWDSRSDGAALSLMVGCASDPDTAGRLYAEHYGAIDPRRQQALAMPVGSWLTCHSICDERFVASSEFYQDYFIPVVGGRYMCGARLSELNGMNAMLAISRPRGQPPYDPTTLNRLTSLTPHLSRAARLHLTISRLKDELSEKQEALNSLALPIVISSGDGRIRFVNRAAESFLKDAMGPLKVQAGRLCARNPSDTARLSNAIDRAVLNSAGAAFVVGKSTFNRLVCTVVPLSARSPLAARWQNPMAGIFLSRPRTDERIDRTILQEIYDLTPAEGRLAVELAAGTALETCAERFGVSIQTVRAQLRAIFLKVGVNRQPELTALLHSLVSPLL